MNSSRSMTSLSSIYLTDTIESSLLEWIRMFEIDSVPHSLDQIYNGVALFELLNKIDMICWPKTQLQKVNNSMVNVNRASIQNFKNIVLGLEKYYREKLDAIINHQTTHYDFEHLVEKRDFETLIDIIELVMGVVVNCEEK